MIKSSLLTNSVLRDMSKSSWQCFRRHINSTTINSTDLTHVDGDGKVNMVDVGAKPDSYRFASASCVVKLGETVFNAVRDNSSKKGDVLTVAKIAGIMGSKHTPNLIPLCHGISASKIDVSMDLDEQNRSIRILAEVSCFGKTGVEMEALTAVSVSGLTVYDMCKAISHNIVISDIQLESKSGGKKDFFRKS